MVRDALQSGIEEADARIIPRVAAAIKDRIQRIVVLSNHTDVLVLLLHYFSQFSLMGVKQFWIKYCLGDESHYIPIHTLADRLGADTCDMLLTVHALTGCDVTVSWGQNQQL